MFHNLRNYLTLFDLRALVGHPPITIRDTAADTLLDVLRQWPTLQIV